MLPKGFVTTCVMVILAISAFSGGSHSPWASVQRSVDAFIKVGDAAGELATAGANATVAITGVAVDAIVVASSALDEAMQGIDVLNISLCRTTCKAVASNRESLAQYLILDSKGTVPPAASASLAGKILGMSLEVPASEVSQEYFSATGVYWSYWGRVTVRSDRTLAAALIVRNASFTTQWINPMWDILGFCVTSESPRIVDKVGTAFSRLNPIEDSKLDISEEALEKEFGLGSSWKTWTRFGWKMLRAAVVLAVAYGRIRYGSFKMLVSMLLLSFTAALERLQVWVTTQMADGWAIWHECDEVAVEESYIIPEEASASGLPATEA